MSARLRRSPLAVVSACAVLALSQPGCGRRAYAEVPASEVLTEMRGDARPLVLDVRTPAEFSAGHVPGALNISIDELGQRIRELADHRDSDIVVYCERGPRAVKAAGLLADAGFGSVRHMEGDMSGWRAAGLPIE
jgi:rhodanese-related sulfurtransferase